MAYARSSKSASRERSDGFKRSYPGSKKKALTQINDPLSRKGLSPADLRSLPLEKPHFLEPMKALISDMLPSGSEWLYELKFDGVRALAIKEGSQVSLLSRAGNNFAVKYSEILDCL